MLKILDFFFFYLQHKHTANRGASDGVRYKKLEIDAQNLTENLQMGFGNFLY